MPRNQLIQIRRDTTANWTNTNPIPAQGEMCYDTNTGYMKIGDGSSNYVNLPVFTHGAAITEAIGIEWDTSSTSPTLKRIDINGNERSTVDATYFDNHSIWGNIQRCTIDPATSTPVYGTNARGDGLDLTGASGNVMVRIPKFYVKFSTDDTIHRWWISPYPLGGFVLHPAFVQRGGTEAQLFVSAYEAAGYMDSSTPKLKSATGLQPMTGENTSPTMPNSGRFYIGDGETYANNVGTGYGITNIWTLSALRLLFYTEYASLSSQTVLGRGIVDLSSGSGYAGLLTGALSANTNIGTNGTGTGTGTNGQTPIVYRGIENLWGNVWKWIIGINFYDTVHRIIRADGTGTMAVTLASGSYDESASVPPNTSIAASGYISQIFTDSTLKYLLLGSACAGSDSTYLCDHYYLRAASGTPTNLRFGGTWHHGSAAGAGYLASNNGSANSTRHIGARLEFLKR